MSTPGATLRPAFARLAPRRSVLPGFRLTLGLAVTYLSLVVLIPLSTVVLRGVSMGWGALLTAVTEPRALAALRLSFGAALTAAAVNVVFGFLVAWVLERVPFPGRRIVDALVDLPFALPTAVAGIALTAVYAETGWLGAPLARIGIKVAYTPLGIALALAFVGLPFVVRTVQPVLRDLDPEIEEAAVSLGAARWQVFARVVLPELRLGLLTGFGLAFARALGEYGSVIFIAGNMPFRTEIAPLVIMIKLEQYDVAGAAALALALLVASFAVLTLVAALQRREHRVSRAR